MPEHKVIILTDADQERLSELQRAVIHAERRATVAKQESFGAALRGGDEIPDDGNADVEAAQAEYDAFIDESAERAEEWVLKSIGFQEFRDLLRQHPPRKSYEANPDGSTREEIHPEDAAWNVNTEEFPRALLLFVDPEDSDIRTVHELKDGDENIAANADKLRKRVKRLSEGQFDALWTNAYVLNKAGVKDPKLDRFSPVTPRSNET